MVSCERGAHTFGKRELKISASAPGNKQLVNEAE